MNFFVHVPGTHLWGIYLQNISDFREDISSDFLGIARLLFKVVIPIYTSTSSIWLFGLVLPTIKNFFQLVV